MRWLIAALCAGLTACTAEILPSQVVGVGVDTGAMVGDAETGLDVASSTTTDGGVGRDALPSDRGPVDAAPDSGLLPDATTATAADAGAGRDATTADALPLDTGLFPLDTGLPVDSGPRPDGGTIPDAGGTPDA